MNFLQYLQHLVAEWVRSRLGEGSLLNRRERAARVLEEALELAQAEGVPPEMARALLDRVYSRPTGEPDKEAAGLAVTLLAWAAGAGADLGQLAEEEISRIRRMSDADLRRRVAEKVAAGVSYPSSSVKRCAECNSAYNELAKSPVQTGSLVIQAHGLVRTLVVQDPRTAGGLIETELTAIHTVAEKK